MFLRFLPFYSDDDGGGSGAGDAGDVKASDIINRYGKNEDAALRLAEKTAELENKLYRLRERNRELTRERDDLKTKLPAEGAVVIAKEDAATLEQYRAIGKPEDVKKALETKGTAEQELSIFKREKLLGRAAELAKFEPTVFATLADKLDIQIKGTAETPLPVVVADGQETALEDYAKAHWTKFDASLRANSSSYVAPDINAGARSGQTGATITDAERAAASRRYSATF